MINGPFSFHPYYKVIDKYVAIDKTICIKNRGFMLLLIVDRLFFVYTIMLFARILGSWLPEIQQFRFMQFIAFYTDPYLNLFRRIIPPLGMLDISPIFAFLGLNVIKYVINTILINLFY